MRIARVSALAAAALAVAACDTEPVTPELDSARQSWGTPVNVVCPSSVDVGSSAFCYAWIDQGGFQMILMDAQWSTGAPWQLSVDSWGTITGHAPGYVAVQAAYQGSMGVAYVTVNDTTSPPPPPPPLTVTIHGPDEVGTNQECGFWASVTGGGSIPTYTWSVQGATGFSSGATWQGQSSGSSFTLSVTARSDGRVASTSKVVTVTPGYMALCQTMNK